MKFMSLLLEYKNRTKKINCVFLGLVLVFSLTGCQTEKSASEENNIAETSQSTNANQTTDEIQTTDETQNVAIPFDTFQGSINEKRKIDLDVPLSSTVDQFGIIEKDAVEDFTDEEIEALVRLKRYAENVSQEDALADVETLFKLLKTSYGGYSYFGGDEEFDEAKSRIIERVKQTSSDEKLFTGKFHNILVEELSFIEDSHFAIGTKSTKFKEKYIYYDAGNTDFFQDEDGFYTLINREKNYLSSEDETYLHVTVNDDGNLVYGIFAVAEGKANLPQKFTLKTKESKENSLKVTWTQTNVAQRVDRAKVHSTVEKDGIKVTSLGRMSIAESDLELTNEFINEAKDLRNEKVFILDLRGNNGGFDLINQFFLYNLTGSICEFKMQTVKRYSKLNLYNEMVNFEALGGKDGYSFLQNFDFYNENKELIDSQLAERTDFTKVEPGETIVINNKGEWKDYQNNIIVLIDKNTYSAGELFLYQLSTVNNVIIMGTNSNGCLLTGDVNALVKISLPNSGITINYSQTLLLADKSKDFDTVGWVPDIITRGDALDAAVSMIKANNLEN